MKKNRVLQISCITLIIAGFATMPLPYCHFAWIPGVLYILCSAIGSYLVVRELTSRVDALDKKLSANSKEQLSLLFEIVGLVFLLFAGIVLLLHPIFKDVANESSFATLVHVAHRYAGFNYYDDTLGLNTLLLFVSFFGAILLGGFLITTFTNILQEKKNKYLSGAMTYKLNGHFVILGFSDIIFTLCRELLKGNSSPTIILTNQDISRVRSMFKSKLPNEIFQRIILYSGNIDEQESLAKMNIDKCKEIYILGEQDAIGHDSTNLNVLKQLNGHLPSDYSGKLKVYLQMDSQSSFSVIQKLDVPDDYTSKGGDTTIDLHTFNVYENQARRLWGYYKDKDSWELDFSDISGPMLLPNSNKRVNLVIAGFDRMGQALLLEALRVCHYPNYIEEKNCIKTKITLIDKNMDELWPLFMARYPSIMQIEDIEIDHYSESLESPFVRQLIDEYAKDENELLTIAVCFWDPDTSFAAGFSLPEAVFFSIKDGHGINNTHTRVLIRNESNIGIKDIISDEKKHQSRYKNVKFFGSIEDGLSHSLMDDKAAILQCAHFDTAFGEPANDKKAIVYKELVAKYGLLKASDQEKLESENYSILNIYQERRISASEVLAWSRLFWDETPENHRCSNRYQIEMYGIFEKYLPCLKNCFADNYEEIISQMEHRRWCAERFIMGYRFEDYQSADSVKKEKDFWRVHNDLRPFSELANKEKAKDLVYLTIGAIKDIVENNDVNE